MPPKEYRGAERTRKSEVGLGKDERPQNARSMGIKSVVGANDLQESQKPEAIGGTPANTNAQGQVSLATPHAKLAMILGKL